MQGALKHKGTRTIETERLILRRFEVNDAELMFKNWASDPDVTKFMTWLPYENPEGTRKFIEEEIKGYENETKYHWVIVYKQSGEPVGSLGAYNIDKKTLCCEIGYCLSKSLWNKGVMSEAARAVVAYLFTEIGFNRVQAKHDVNNPGSGRVMDKCGMKPEGILRSYGYKESLGFQDLAMHSILRSEFEKEYFKGG